jgi:hypothetical protein
VNTTHPQIILAEDRGVTLEDLESRLCSRFTVLKAQDLASARQHVQTILKSKGELFAFMLDGLMPEFPGGDVSAEKSVGFIKEVHSTLPSVLIVACSDNFNPELSAAGAKYVFKKNGNQSVADFLNHLADKYLQK